MKYLAVLPVVLGVALTGCGGSGSSSSSPTAPTGPSATHTTFTLALMPSNEVPPITNADASITGTATITIHANKDSAGNVTSATADFQLNASGFPPGAALNMAHIHPGAAGSNGGVLVSTGMTAGTVTITNGSATYTSNGVNVPPDQAQAILANPAAYYFNIHTSLNAGGAARGQLSGGQPAGTPPPTTSPGY
jgi:hypothetical protein